MAEWIIEIKDGKFPIGKWTELVRCKDCKRNHTEECSMWYESDNHQEQYSWNKPDDFCSYGERKEGEE